MLNKSVLQGHHLTPMLVHPSQGGEELPLQAVPVPVHAALWEKVL